MSPLIKSAQIFRPTVSSDGNSPLASYPNKPTGNLHMETIRVVKKADIVSSESWREQKPEEALTLPSRYFFDDTIFRSERDRIFMSAWHVIGHKSELSEPGQFVMTDIFDQSVIATCGVDGVVHAFHNVCQHRGNRLVEERRGTQTGVFRCAYDS